MSVNPQLLVPVPGGASVRVRHGKHLKKPGAVLIREESRHSIFQKGGRKTQVPRHNEIVDELARKICKDLDLPFVR